MKQKLIYGFLVVIALTLGNIGTAIAGDGVVVTWPTYPPYNPGAPNNPGNDPFDGYDSGHQTDPRTEQDGRTEGEAYNDKVKWKKKMLNQCTLEGKLFLNSCLRSTNTGSGIMAVVCAGSATAAKNPVLGLVCAIGIVVFREDGVKDCSDAVAKIAKRCSDIYG